MGRNKMNNSDLGRTGVVRGVGHDNRNPQKHFNKIINNDFLNTLLTLGVDIKKLKPNILNVISVNTSPYKINEELINLVQDGENDTSIFIQSLLVADMSQDNWPKLLHTIIIKTGGLGKDNDLSSVMAFAIKCVDNQKNKSLIFDNIVQYLTNEIKNNNISPYDSLVMLSVLLHSPGHISENKLEVLRHTVEEVIANIDVKLYGKHEPYIMINEPNNPAEHDTFSEWYVLLKKIKLLQHYMHYADVVPYDEDLELDE
ncbi:hypothetical protein J7J90_02080 [Candidatus Micrarchaeota archaeon]|nr:hypothetical protein [Candidatus Micrarchaeota archaeon]